MGYLQLARRVPSGVSVLVANRAVTPRAAGHFLRGGS
jgi:hypothetical protein